MPRRDVYHNVVIRALVKDGWKITHDPLHIGIGQLDFYIDLAAEIQSANEHEQKVAIEIKNFRKKLLLTEFHLAVGQYLNYRLILSQRHSDRTLYLAVPQRTYDSFFQTRFGKLAIVEHNLKLVVYDRKQEVITKWIG